MEEEAWAARAAELCDSPLREPPAAPPPMRPPMPPPPMMPPPMPAQLPRMEPPPPPLQQVEIIGDTAKVHFFGVADKNWNLAPSGVGIKRGTTGKGEFTFFVVVSLKADATMQQFSTVEDFVGFVLKNCLDLPAASALGTQVKVIDLEAALPGHAPPTKMVDFSRPIVVSSPPWAESSSKVELVIYLRAAVLHGARARAASANIESFKERAQQVAGVAISKNAFAQLVGLGRGTIDDALRAHGQPGNTNTLDHVERFMRKHYASNFSEIGVAMAAAKLKATSKAAGKAKVTTPQPLGAAMLGGAEAEVHTVEAKKRARTYIPPLAAVHIDAYLPQYKDLKDEQRVALVVSIKESADAINPAWALTNAVIATRLGNQLKLANKKARLEAGVAPDEVQ